jgi:hypothetical protein
MVVMPRMPQPRGKGIRTIKDTLRILHDTNEMIISGLAKAFSGEGMPKKLSPPVPHPETNLLHGDGWMVEVLAAMELEQQGYLGFVTFGTLFDPDGVDVIGFRDSDEPIPFSIPIADADTPWPLHE